MFVPDIRSIEMFVELIKKNYEKTWFGFFVALLMSFLTVALPTWLGGLRQTIDMRSHLHFAHAFRDAIAVGDFYPGWADDNLGFGSVGIRFYPPVSDLFTAILHLASGDWHFAFTLALLIWMLLGCFGMYLFVREWSSLAYGILACILYAVVPYHFAQIYRFFLYAEFAGLAVLPFCLLYLTRICRNGKWSDVFPFALSCSVLALTHIPLTLMTAFSLIVFILIAIDWRYWKRVSLQLVVSGLLVSAATAFFWIRVITELSWVAHSDERYTVAGYDSGPMLFPYLLVSHDIRYEYPILRHLDIVTVLTIMLLTSGIAVLFVQRKNLSLSPLRVLAATTGSAVFGVFMLSKPSEVLWYGLSILQRLQYPWRWLAVVSALAVVSISLSVSLLVEAGRISRRAATYGAVLLIFGFGLVDIKQIHGTPFRISASRFNEFAAEMRSERVAEHWWPSWAKAEAFEKTEPVMTSDRRKVEVGAWGSKSRTFTVGEGDSESVRVATFYYPHWRATVNGRDVEVGKDDSGTIKLQIANERSDVELRFEEPLMNTIASWLSVATWIFLFCILAFRLGLLKAKTSDMKQ